ncbi:hypothetical protein RSOLAG1IB_12580 [Rhizoctonia solani AG-1 IB]|uniref:Secreted protein n=1 Tax=Thanatephorus cucumeris (strain AG1-IB / isolate 7/3/14) TaxID=1108050 RepID=A0A0B7FYP6_THACB|nr:hypothetical protein RSOLAG1IB_12580 [Rhizoctonia solani AG-1 IB]
MILVSFRLSLATWLLSYCSRLRVIEYPQLPQPYCARTESLFSYHLAVAICTHIFLSESLLGPSLNDPRTTPPLIPLPPRFQIDASGALPVLQTRTTVVSHCKPTPLAMSGGSSQSVIICGIS